ncbi:glycosyltransferase [Chryseobacterium sp. SC28]|uniref:glycosyltransferase n=1 Tax=Chryseobacterium sp. SC28 TaxID=2268028 RepID=UPI000F6503D1|nr:glycosyltransferase [Chryseobacterium sp. SC28]RRQ45336.1 glycosyltransferase family 1 protein [Chryseobacterium sp. SC28]
MKILHVITRSDLGGAQSVVITLANAMSKDHQVTVAAGEDGPMWDALDRNVRKVKIPEIVRPISLLKDIKAAFKLRKLYKTLNPDVIHLHSSKAGVLGRLVFPKHKTVYSVHGFDSIRLSYKKFLPVERLMKNRCKAIVVASSYDRQNMIKEGIANNLYVIHNGVEIPELENNLHIAGLENYKKTVMCIARLSPQKRFESYVEIARKLPEYAFVWIGVDEKYDNLPTNLFCIGSVPNAKKYIQIADIFVLPTNYEGVPIVIIDALSYGKPVVSSDVGGISEIVRNGYNGFVLHNDDNIFADRIKYILNNNEIYKSFSKKSLEIFYKDLTTEKMIEAYYEVYTL